MSMLPKGWTCPQCGDKKTGTQKFLSKQVDGKFKKVPVILCDCGLIMEPNTKPSGQAEFNHGFKCPKCGPQKDGKKKTINKTQHTICNTCQNIMEPWIRPLKERRGRCNTCAHGKFELAMHKGHLLRKCKQCGEVYDTKTQLIRRRGIDA